MWFAFPKDKPISGEDLIKSSKYVGTADVIYKLIGEVILEISHGIVGFLSVSEVRKPTILRALRSSVRIFLSSEQHRLLTESESTF
jgi:hypothetical protein